MITSEIDKNKEELMKEARLYNKLRESDKTERRYKDPTEVFLIEKGFLKKWKEYVNYSLLKRIKFQKDMDISFTKSIYPGQINNQPLLVPLSEFINEGNKNNPDRFAKDETLPKNSSFNMKN